MNWELGLTIFWVVSVLLGIVGIFRNTTVIIRRLELIEEKLDRQR